MHLVNAPQSATSICGNLWWCQLKHVSLIERLGRTILLQYSAHSTNEALFNATLHHRLHTTLMMQANIAAQWPLIIRDDSYCCGAFLDIRSSSANTCFLVKLIFAPFRSMRTLPDEFNHATSINHSKYLLKVKGTIERLLNIDYYWKTWIKVRFTIIPPSTSPWIRRFRASNVKKKEGNTVDGNEQLGFSTDTINLAHQQYFLQWSSFVI